MLIQLQSLFEVIIAVYFFLNLSNCLFSSVRGRLGSLLMQFANAGFLIAFLAGYYLNYHTIPYIGIGVALVFMLAFSFFPETPSYLLRNQKDGVR